MSTLYVRDGSGYRIACATDILERAESLLAQRFRSGSPVLSSPSLTHAFLRAHLGGREFETFGILHLDQRHRLIAAEDLFRGTINGAAVHPREVVKSVIAHNSAATLLYHNHPLCFVGGVNRGIKGRFGLALTRLKVSRRHARQGAALLATGSLLCSPEVASRACDEACCGVRGVLVGNPAHSIE